MKSYIVLGDTISQEEFAKRFILEHQVKSYNTHIYNQKVKIADVREIQKILSFRAGTGYTRIILFKNEITSEAQNALLKTLEELPDNTFSLIFSTNGENILPTVLSRSFVVGQRPLDGTPVPAAREFITGFYEAYKNKSHYIVWALVQAEEIATKDNSMIDLVRVAREQMLSSVASGEINQVVLIEKLLSQLLCYSPLIDKNNVNKRMVLEKILLDLT